MKCLNIKQIVWVSLLMLLFLLAPRTAAGMEPRVSFNEVAQTADLIFIGTVVDQGCRLNDRQTMVFTDVFFDDISILHATVGAVQKENSMITLTYAGGFVEGYGVTVSGTPKLETDQRYLIFTRDDGLVYANPIVGGSQGLFRIIEDLETGEEHVLAAGDRAVTGFSGDSITTGSDRVLAIESGKLYTEIPSNTVTLESPPISSKPGSSARISNYRDSEARPLPLSRFIRHLEGKALTAPLGHRVLRQGSEGKFYRGHGQKMEAENLQPADPSSLTTLKEIRQKYHDQPRVPLAGEIFEPASRGERRTDSTDDGDLCYCGFQGPYLEMEQVAETSWAFSIQNYAMWSYNELVDLYRYFPDDGGFGINFESEFIGWASDALMDDVYGFNWNGYLAVCINWFTWVCSEIVESDIAYNPAYGWTDDPEYSYTHSNAHLLLPTTMHELGHSWGALTGTCDETYSYIHPTVMHAEHDVIEDGKGIHMIDAGVMRLIYPDVVEPSTMDIGVESYYAAGDLNNSTTDQDDYYPGDSISLYNVTTENMTSFALNDVRIRFFLSPDTTITTADYQLGNDAFWNWPFFPENSYSVLDYHTTIPSSVPAGSYYIGAMVSINGFSSDHFTDNNITRFRDPINVIVDLPAAPTNVQATDAAYCDRVLVNWDTSAGASEYRVIRNGYTVSDWQSGTTFEDDSAVAGWVYSYAVKARNSGGESGYSAADAGSINTVPPGPTGVSASDGTYDYGVRITWNEVENAEDYHVIRDMALLSDWMPGTEFIDTSAEPGVVYIYNVWSRNACGEGGFSSPDEGYAPVESTGIFASPVGYPTGDSSRCVAIGDLDGDGSTDLIAANYSSNDISVILGLGDGTFSAATSYSVGTSPASVAIGDLNNDGSLDLVSANQGDDSVAVLLGSGDGSFSAAQFFPVGDEPWSVVLADLNGDTLPDVAVTNSGSNSVSGTPGTGQRNIGLRCLSRRGHGADGHRRQRSRWRHGPRPGRDEQNDRQRVRSAGARRWNVFRRGELRRRDQASWPGDRRHGR